MFYVKQGLPIRWSITRGIAEVAAAAAATAVDVVGMISTPIQKR